MHATRRHALAAFAALGGAVAVSELLPVGLFASGVLVVAVALAGVVALVPGVWTTLYRRTGVGRGAWILAATVAGGGIALAHAAGDPQPFCEGIVPYRGCLTLHGWASAVFVGSTLGVAIATGHLDRYRRLRRATVAPAADVSEGLTAVEGRLVPAGRTVPGPVSGSQTAWYRTAVEEPAAVGGYRETEVDTDGGDLYVADGSGRILVLPGGLDAHDVAALARSHTVERGERRHREWSYEPDDAVTVVGRATDVSRAEYPEPTVVGLEGPVILGLGSLSDLRSWAARRAVGGGALALLVGGTSLAVMLLTA